MEAEITVSLGFALSIFLGIAVPVLLYFWKLHGLARDHKIALERHILDEEVILNRTADETTKVKYAIRELSHYTRWLAEIQTGKRPPPYVKNGD